MRKAKMNEQNNEIGAADEVPNINLQAQETGNLIEDLFIPINNLNNNVIPVNYRHIEVETLVLLLKKLTVYVTTSATSDKRPLLVPDTNIPYPYVNDKGTSKYRTGTGRILRVIEMNEPCNCVKCNTTGAAKFCSYYHVAILVPKYLIFDKSEINHPGCRIILVNYVGPDDTPIFFRIISGDDIPGDWVVLWGCIHDENLGIVLERYLNEFEEHYETINQMCKIFTHLDNMAIVIRTRENLSQEVAIGSWLDNHAGGNQDRLTMNVLQCFGPMGALIHRVGCGNDHPGYGPKQGRLNHTCVKFEALNGQHNN